MVHLRFVMLLRHAATVAALLLSVSIGADAGPHRARLSRDLAERLAAGRSEAVRVIVSGDRGRIDAIAARHGGQVRKLLQGAAVVEFPGDRLQGVADDPEVDHLSGDVPVRRLMSVTTEAIGANQVWSGLGGSLERVTGRGIGVAVIDSGVSTHRSLVKRVVAAVDFTGGSGEPRDEYGHGTHVAGIIAGDQQGVYPGVAPGAHVVSLRVLSGDGVGYTSDVIAAIQWAIANRDRYNLRIINLSLGHPVFESYRDDPLCQAVEQAVQAGLVVVAAAGNFGKTADGQPILGGIVSPGNSPAALTVGAINTRGTAPRSDDIMATYSSRGPTAFDGLLKPDVVAPGNRVVAAAAAGSYLVRTYPERMLVGQRSEPYLELSGTSMSAAVVSGAAALLLDANERLTPAQVKFALQVTSSPVANAGLLEAGAGSVNVLAAVQLAKAGPSALLPTTTIASEEVQCSGVAFGTGLRPNTAPWGDAVKASADPESDILVWGNSDILVWGNTEILVWGNSDILVWGNSTTDGDILVWGNTDILVWGNSDILVWGNSSDDQDILVWGNSEILVWGNTDILVWGNSDILVWGNTDILVWGNANSDNDILVWGNSSDDDILVWGN